MLDNSQADDLEVHDVIIIGAGPCGLAVAARLRERHPSALFTDEEQARYQWMQRNQHRAAIKNKKSGKTSCSRRTSCSPSMLVLDSSGGDWMTRWHRLFGRLEIPHLRSPLFFHPDPSNRDALLAFAHEQGRMNELREIKGCVGKEVSKHKRKKRMNARSLGARPAVEIDERDRKDYFTPSTSCFRDFCENITTHYGLDDSRMIRHETVRSLDFDYFDQVPDAKVFRVETDAGTRYARAVVMAIGGGDPIIPLPFPRELPSYVSHAMDLDRSDLIAAQLEESVRGGRETAALVIGGGLTSAQVVDCLLRKGISRVHLIMRGPLKVKPFDINLTWMSKFRNHQRAVFWTADDLGERLRLAKEARNGGSMTPAFHRVLQRHVDAGKLKIHTHTSVVAQSFDARERKCRVKTAPERPELPLFDHIYLATGMHLDVNHLDLFRTLNTTYPVETHGGLPDLTDDLMWRSDVPLFMTGKMAMLQLGPSAGNLEGARLGAERIAWAIERQLERCGCSFEEESPNDPAGAGRREARLGYAAGVGNRFEELAVSMAGVVA